MLAYIVMEAIRKDSTIAQDVKDYLQWVFSRRSSAEFLHAVSAKLGRIPF